MLPSVNFHFLTSRYGVSIIIFLYTTAYAFKFAIKISPKDLRGGGGGVMKKGN